MTALAIVVPALDAAATIGPTLAALERGRSRFALDIVVADGGSCDDTTTIAEAHGARAVAAPRGRGPQLVAGARAAAGDWLVFVHADTVLAADWPEAVAAFVADPANAARAGHFRFALDDTSRAARRLERLVTWRSRGLGLPYGDQGLLLARTFYDSLGGFREMALMEDVDMVRRIGRRRMRELPAIAVTSSARYRREGYWRRPARNLLCLTLYLLGAPPRLVERVYG